MESILNMILRGCFVVCFGVFFLHFSSTRCYKRSEILMLVLFGSVWVITTLKMEEIISIPRVPSSFHGDLLE